MLEYGIRKFIIKTQVYFVKCVLKSDFQTVFFISSALNRIYVLIHFKSFFSLFAKGYFLLSNEHKNIFNASLYSKASEGRNASVHSSGDEKKPLQA